MDSSSAVQKPAPSETSPVATGGAFKRVFHRIFTRHLMNIALLMTLPVIFTTSLNPQRETVRDPDIWWHLADARLLCSTHHFIETEPYSFTVAGQRWVNPEWLAELPYWFSYNSLGLRGIYLAEWLLLGGNLVFFYWRSYWNSGHAGAAWWAAALGFLLVSVNAGPRMIAIAYLAMGAELAILESAERGKKHLLWLLPLLFCVWVNVHGSWLIGLGLFVLYILCGSFDFTKGIFAQEAFSKPDRNRLLGVLGVTIAALMVNPYGWRLVWNPIDMMLNQKLNIANVQEWHPLDLSSVAGIAAAGAMALMVIANSFKGRKWRVYEMAIIFFAWYSALDHMRFLFMAAVLTTPLLAVDIRRGFSLESDEKTIPAANAVMVFGAACLIAAIFPSNAQLQKKLGTFFPMESIAEVQPEWRTFNSDFVGGMMTFQSKSPFIDSRFDTFEHHGVLKDYLRAMYLTAPLEVYDKYRIDHVLVTETMPDAYLLERTPGWTVIKREKTGGDTYVTFARTLNFGPGTGPFAPDSTSQK
jgi:hypothetical protein